MNAIATLSGDVKLIPARQDRNSKSQVARFVRWVGRDVLNPDLAEYRDHLLETLSPSSVSAHLSSVRAAYKKLTRDRDLFYAHIPRQYADTPANQKAWVDEVITRLENAIDPDAAKVEKVTEQDVEDGKYLRLKAEQADRLMASPGVDTLKGLRDTAIIALVLCTGLREAEICSLQVDDLRQTYGGELALRVRKGKGNKKRLVPYGALSWVLVIVDKWLERAGINEGHVFRGFWRGGKTLRGGGLSVRQVERVLQDNPINVDGELKQVKPHDLRRTYARRMYKAGMDILAIRDNLGHADHKTTLGYIGKMDPDRRRGKDVYHFDLSQLS